MKDDQREQVDVATETVKIYIHVLIDHDEMVDTGYTVTQWNAMTWQQRSEIKAEYWSTAAEHDTGGTTVITEGAME
jgi:hypothetical protein